MFFSTMRPTILLWTLLGLLTTARAALADDPPVPQGDPATAQRPKEKAPAESPPAGSEGLLWRRFELSFGAAYSAINSELRLSKKGQAAGLAVDPEQALGMSSEVFTPEVWTAFRSGIVTASNSSIPGPIGPQRKRSPATSSSMVLRTP
jgi:hypothetical protein